MAATERPRDVLLGDLLVLLVAAAASLSNVLLGPGVPPLRDDGEFPLLLLLPLLPCFSSLNGDFDRAAAFLLMLPVGPGREIVHVDELENDPPPPPPPSL